MYSRLLEFSANLLQILAFKLRNQVQPSPATESGSDKRRFDRYVGPFNSAISVKMLKSGLIYEVKDISYGGLAFADPSRSPKIAALTPEPIELRILNRSIQTKLTVLGVRGDSTACLFHHESPETLLFLRESLEGFRKGASVRVVPASLLQDKYRNGKWLYLRGAGPTDILLSQGPTGNLESALVTVQAGDRYAEVRVFGGHVQTGKSIDQEGASASRMGATENLDLDLVHHVSCIFLNIKQSEAETLTSQTLAALQEGLRAATIPKTAAA